MHWKNLITKGIKITIKQATLFRVQSRASLLLRHSWQVNRHKETTKLAKGLVKLVKISPNMKSLKRTPPFPKGRKFLMKVIQIPFLNCK